MKFNLVSNSKGQFVIEAVLLIVVALGVFAAATRIAREQKLLAKLVGEPWAVIAGMTESGVWKPANTARNEHPNNYKRVRTPDTRN